MAAVSYTHLDVYKRQQFIFKENFYVIAINAGSLGFLTEIKRENIFEEYDNFLNNNCGACLH